MKKVLIVDDEESFLLSLEAGFESYADMFTLLTAQNGIEAIEVLEKNQIDLVVTDLKMPEMDGFQLLVHINNTYPGIPVIVITAFNSPEIEKNISEEYSIKILEKPVDFDELSQAIINSVSSDVKGVTGISLVSFMQLIGNECKTSLLEISTGEKTGYIYFEEGEPFSAIYDGLRGEDAIYALALIEDVSISLPKLPKKKVKREITSNLMYILLEAMKRKDDSDSPENEVNEDGMETVSGDDDRVQGDMFDEIDDDDMPDTDMDEGSASATGDAEPSEPEFDEQPDNGKDEITGNDQKGEVNMSEVSEILERFKGVNGFQAVGIFTANGEMVNEVNSSSIDIAEIGAYANDILLKSQQTTELMGVGRGQLIHVEAPKAHVLARCLNESTDFAANTSGRAHIHMVLILEKEGNVGMAKIKLESIIQEIAPSFR